MTQIITLWQISYLKVSLYNWCRESDVYRDEAGVDITFEGWLILMLIEKECIYCFVIWQCLSSPNFISSSVIFTWIKCSKCTWKETTVQISETFMRCAKEMHLLLNYCSHKLIEVKMIKFLIQNISLVEIYKSLSLSEKSHVLFQYIILAVMQQWLMVCLPVLG